MENKNYLKELLSTVFIFALVALAFRMCAGKKELSNGVYVLGRVVKADRVQGANYAAISFFAADTARTAFVPVKDPGVVGDLYFVRVWKEVPGKVVFDPAWKVPACFDTTGYPQDGYEYLPDCN